MLKSKDYQIPAAGRSKSKYRKSFSKAEARGNESEKNGQQIVSVSLQGIQIIDDSLNVEVVVPLLLVLLLIFLLILGI